MENNETRKFGWVLRKKGGGFYYVDYPIPTIDGGVMQYNCYSNGRIFPVYISPAVEFEILPLEKPVIWNPPEKES